MCRRRVKCFLVRIGLLLAGAIFLAGCHGGGGGTSTPSSAVDDSLLYVSGVNVFSSDVLLSYNNANTVSGSPTTNRIVTGGATTLSDPRGIAVDMPRNRMYVANHGNNSILVFDNARTASGGLAPGHVLSAGPLSGPTALFIDPVHDRLYVANTGANSVLVFDNVSTLNGAVAPDRTVAGAATGLNAPAGIYVDATRNLLYVSNAGGNQILVFSNAATVTGNMAPANSIGGLSSPGGIFADLMADRLYVVNTGANSIFVFDNASKATSLSAPNRVLSGGASGLNQPRDIFVDTGTDRAYVTNAADHSILVFNGASTANNPAAPDRRLTPSPTTTPWGIYVDATPVVVGSTGTLDGYARSDNTASSSGSPAIGDKDGTLPNVGWRQLYSFDISSLPATATILSASLRLYQCSVAGLPYARLGNVLVDQVNYGNALSAGAYDGMTVVSNIGTLSTDSALGYRSLNVATRVQNDLMAARTASQYRLRFSLLDRFTNGADDYAQFTDAEDSTCAGTTTNQPPQLAVSLRP